MADQSNSITTQEQSFIEVESMSIDQLAGSVVLVFGAVGSLLLVIWQSRCACKCRIGCSDKCYIFDCSREPPPEDKDKKKDNNLPKNPVKDKDKDKDKESLIPPTNSALELRSPSPEPETIQATDNLV